VSKILTKNVNNPATIPIPDMAKPNTNAILAGTREVLIRPFIA